MTTSLQTSTGIDITTLLNLMVTMMIVVMMMKMMMGLMDVEGTVGKVASYAERGGAWARRQISATKNWWETLK